MSFENAIFIHFSRDRYARTPLHLVASNGNEPILWQLLSHGADVHAKDCDGATALHRAIDAGHDDVARMILDRGCSLDVADVDGDTALHVAVRRENNEILAILLRKGANPDLKNGLGDAPLHEAIKTSLISTGQLLLRGGAEVNLPGERGLTPLMLAAQNPDLNVLLDNLLNFEADPLIQDDQGLNALDHACDVEVRHVLENFIADSCHRGLSDAHSFDETLDDNEAKNDDYTLPFGMTDDQPIHDQDHLQDLDSWQSSHDSYQESKMKTSKGMFDLSKFNLEDSGHDNDQGQVPEKIYDSVENVREEVKKLEALGISTPLLRLKEPELIQDVAQVHEDPEDYSEWDDDSVTNLPLETSRRLDIDSEEALVPLPLRAPKGLKDLKKSPKKSTSPKFKTPPMLSPNVQSFEQPRSLDSKTPTKRRRGSRKSRSLRSTHLAMMSKPILTTSKNEGSESSIGNFRFSFFLIVNY